MPAGADTNDPLPVPTLCTLSVRLAVCCVNVAVTSLSPLIVSWHGPVPAHADHPWKTHPAAGCADSVTLLPQAKQSPVPEGQGTEPVLDEMVTVPLPAVNLVRRPAVWAASAAGSCCQS
jgi:hypothetical protein